MAGQKNQNGKWARLRRSIICWLKEELEFIDVKIMSYVLAVILMVSVTAATVAWFLISSSTKVSGLNLTTGTAEDIEISLNDENWVNILEAYSETEGKHGDVSTLGIEIAMSAFENIYDKTGMKVESADSGIMAPGTYGEFSFYVKSVNPTYDACQINIAKVLTATVEDEFLMSEVDELLKGHILCFAKVGDNYAYVSEEHPLELSFTFSGDVCQPQEVVVYWVWPYEYRDLATSVMQIGSLAIGSDAEPIKLFGVPAEAAMPDSLSLTGGASVTAEYQLACNQVFEWGRYNKMISEFSGADDKTREEMFSDWYDYADTLVGTCVENVVFHIGVKGVMSDE